MLDRRNLPLSALRAFECAGRHLHLGRAGMELGVTHGAISHQVRALEQKLGLKLFSRANNRLKLTSAGEQLLISVREGFDRIVDGALHLNPDSVAGELTIGCTQTSGSSWAVKHIMQFQANYPQMAIRVLEVGPLQQQIPRDIDIAICYGKPEVNDRRLEDLISLSVFPVCSPTLVFGQATVETPRELARLPLLHDNQNSWSKWFSETGIETLTLGQQTYFFSTVLSLAAARKGYGVALCNPLEVQDDLREGRLVRLLEHAIPESQNYYLLCDPVETQSRRAQLFEEWMQNVMRNLPI
ncbi:MAG: LysR family glycine cleavage system transcriptional activator [Gammaproteobacteria bacterium]